MILTLLNLIFNFLNIIELNNSNISFDLFIH